VATITIRNLDEKVKRRLQVRAALNGRSMEAEARELLTETVGLPPARGALKTGLGTAIHNLFAPLGGVKLQAPPRRKSPDKAVRRKPLADDRPKKTPSL
jgi:plasmid stability protein